MSFLREYLYMCTIIRQLSVCRIIRQLNEKTNIFPSHLFFFICCENKTFYKLFRNLQINISDMSKKEYVTNIATLLFNNCHKPSIHGFSIC